MALNGTTILDSKEIEMGILTISLTKECLLCSTSVTCFFFSMLSTFLLLRDISILLNKTPFKIYFEKRVDDFLMRFKTLNVP